jgi:hypothetical protein
LQQKHRLIRAFDRCGVRFNKRPKLLNRPGTAVVGRMDPSKGQDFLGILSFQGGGAGDGRVKCRSENEWALDLLGKTSNLAAPPGGVSSPFRDLLP